MARPVLGNDPFLRGAPAVAARPQVPAEPEGTPPEQPANRTVDGKPGRGGTPRKKGAAARPSPPRRDETGAVESLAEKTRAGAVGVRKGSLELPREEPGASATPPSLEPAGVRGWRARSMDLAGDVLQILDASRALPLWKTLSGAWAALQTGLGLGGGGQLDAYGADSELLAKLQPWRDFLYERYFRVSVQGAGQLPSGACILVGNHAGALPLDGWILTEAVKRERPDVESPRWLMEDQLFTAPFLGTLYNRLGALRASPENAERLLSERRPVAVFPEGIQGIGKPFAQRYRLQRFGRGGFVKLALRLQVPVIPVALVGGEETHPLLAKLPIRMATLPYLPLMASGPLPLPVKWSVRFGEPIDLEGLPASAADDLALVQRLTERTREAIQGMLDDALKQRRSVFAG